MNNIVDSAGGRVPNVEEPRNVSSELPAKAYRHRFVEAAESVSFQNKITKEEEEKEEEEKEEEKTAPEDASDRRPNHLFAVEFVKHRLLSFARDVSIVGFHALTVPSPSTAVSFVRTVVWTLLFLFGAAAMLHQIHERIFYYYSRPTSAVVRIQQNRSLRFPSVTICNENRVSLAATQKLGIANPTVLLSQMFPPFPDVDFTPNYKQYNSSSWTLDWYTFYEQLAQPVKKSILECEFKNAPCNMSNAFRQSPTDMGFCYTFNPDSTNYYSSSQPGPVHGLRLVLFVNQSDYLVTMSPTAGFRFYLHDAYEKPLLKKSGFKVSPGLYTLISFKLTTISQLPAPYGICRDESNYSFGACMFQCEANFSISRCHCRLAEMPGEAKICDPEIIYECIEPGLKEFITSGASRRCDCPLQCRQAKYRHSVSTNRLSDLFLNRTSKLLHYKGLPPMSKERLKKELVFVKLFFSELAYSSISVVPAYDLLRLFSDIGGATGLILGSTILTFVEISQFLVGLAIDIVALKTRPKTRGVAAPCPPAQRRS